MNAFNSCRNTTIPSVLKNCALQAVTRLDLIAKIQDWGLLCCKMPRFLNLYFIYLLVWVWRSNHDLRIDPRTWASWYVWNWDLSLLFYHDERHCLPPSHLADLFCVAHSLSEVNQSLKNKINVIQYVKRFSILLVLID